MKNKARFLLAPIVLAFTSLAMADIMLTAGDFVQNSDGTVTHTPTGLVWQACSVGQTWDGTNGTCTGTAKSYTYANAMKVTSDFAGKTDWRVPNIVELNSIVDLKKYSPAINKSLFPQMPTDGHYITSTIFSDNKLFPNFVWVSKIKEFGQAGWSEDTTYSYYLYDTSTNYVVNSYYESQYIRLVRGQSLSTTLRLSDFKDNNDGSVSHLKTGLVWQRCAVGQTWNNGGCDGKSATYTQDSAVKLTSDLGGSNDWRLPTYKELLTIIDYSQYSPSTNSIVFPDAPSNIFWTSTKSASSDSYGAIVSFQNGAGYLSNDTYTAKDKPYAVRLVRGSMTNSTDINTGGVDLSATISGSPNPAIVNGNMTFTAILTNKGTLTATDAKLSFALPKNSVSLIAKPTECSFTGLSVLCSVGSLAPSSSVTKSVTVKMAKAGGLTFGVTSWAAEKDTNTADNVARTTVAIRK
jgi:hypothetical protein